MKITDIRAHVLKPTEPIYRWRTTMAPRSMQFILLRVLTDAGHEGHCMSWMMLSPGEVKDAMPGWRKTLIGRDPHEVEAIANELTFGLERPTRAASHLDIALWDVVGKYHGEPLYRLFGQARTRLRAYADRVFCSESIEGYVAGAQEVREMGFAGIKLHLDCIPDRDIEVCRAVRKAMGDDFALFIDAHNYYDRQTALKVGKVLQELKFVWFEAPILDSDIQGTAALGRQLDVPIAGTEHLVQGIRALPPFLVGNVCPIYRSIGELMGGISAMRKMAAVCEAFNVKFETHTYGTPHVIGAHLHVALSMHNCDWVELPVPPDAYELGCKPYVRVQRDGYCYAPTGPGLGCEVDMAEIERLTVEEI